jgi:arabinofuranosyltransferase
MLKKKLISIEDTKTEWLIKDTETNGSIEDSKTRWLPITLFIALFAVVLVRNAWLADDAYITFRTVDNFINGYGLTWNVSERVQSYTHPLWMFLLSSFAFFTREVYYTSIFISLLVSLATAGLLAFKVARTQFTAYFVLSILILSKAFIDYSVAGLENPLTHLIIVLFVFVFIRLQPSYQKIFFLSLIVSLGAINRMDVVLFFIPPIMYETILFVRDRGWKNIRLFYALSTGFTPLLLWLLFSTFYYGFPFPNTAYAKLGVGISSRELYKQGIYYFFNSLSIDPLTLTIIMVGILFPFYLRRWREVTIALGIVLYLLYVIRIGGDFMSGRFFTAPLIAAVALLANNHITSVKTFLPAVLVVLIVGLSASASPLMSNAQFGSQNREAIIGPDGIADERAYYYPSTGLLGVNRNVAWPDSAWAHEGREARQQGPAVTVRENIGYFGFFAGPEIHVVDQFGLADPLLARLPAVRNKNWRIGHFARQVPEGYIETLETGQNRFTDESLALFYNKLAFVTRGNLFDLERLREIWNLNTGKYDHLIDYPRYRYGEQVVPLSALSEVKSEGTPWDAEGNIIFPEAGVQIALERIYHAKSWEVSLDHNDDYQVLYFHGNTEIGAQQIAAKNSTDGLAVYQVAVPNATAEQGYNRIVIYPLRGDTMYSIGHIRLLKETG